MSKQFLFFQCTEAMTTFHAIINREFNANKGKHQKLDIIPTPDEASKNATFECNSAYFHTGCLSRLVDDFNSSIIYRFFFGEAGGVPLMHSLKIDENFVNSFCI